MTNPYNVSKVWDWCRDVTGTDGNSVQYTGCIVLLFSQTLPSGFSRDPLRPGTPSTLCPVSEMQCINANRPQPDDIQTAQTNATAYVSSRDVKETLGYETETFGFQSMTRPVSYTHLTLPTILRV